VSGHKIFLHTRPNTFVESITFILPHVDSNRSFNNHRNQFLKTHLDKIEIVEKLTGMTFLSALAAENPAKAVAVRNFKAQVMWPEPEKEPEVLDQFCGL
jgi:hypothetical protein